MGQIVRPVERLAFVLIGEHLHFAGRQVRPRHPRLHLPRRVGRPAKLRTLQRRALASHQKTLRMQQQPVGRVTVLAKHGQLAPGRQFEDPLIDRLREIHVIGGIGRRAFCEGGDGGRCCFKYRRRGRRRRGVAGKQPANGDRKQKGAHGAVNHIALRPPPKRTGKSEHRQKRGRCARFRKAREERTRKPRAAKRKNK